MRSAPLAIGVGYGIHAAMASPPSLVALVGADAAAASIAQPKQHAVNNMDIQAEAAEQPQDHNEPKLSNDVPVAVRV